MKYLQLSINIQRSGELCQTVLISSIRCGLKMKYWNVADGDLRKAVLVAQWIKERVAGGHVGTVGVNARYGIGFWGHLKSMCWHNSQLLWLFIEQ